jgi:CRP-like cAMP-binding protein
VSPSPDWRRRTPPWVRVLDEGGPTLRDVWHLRSVDWLDELSMEEIEKLWSASVYHEYKAGETVFAPASHPHSLYLLERGLVRIYRLSRAGSEASFGYVAPGEVFGEMAAFGDYARESFAAAVRPSRVWKIPADAFRKLLAARPAVALEITRQIGKRLKRIENRVENLIFRDARSRIAQILLELARDFRGERAESIAIDVEFTQGELATLVGTTRQTINANLREFEREGWIGYGGRRIVILRPDALKCLAEGLDPAA